MTHSSVCEICGQGHIVEQCDPLDVTYKGVTSAVPQYFLVCDACEIEQSGSEQGKKNRRAVTAFRKSVDGLLSGTEIKALLEQYHLTQADAAQLFGGGPVAFSKYVNDEVAQSESMDTLLRLVRRSPSVLAELAAMKGISVMTASKISHQKKTHSETMRIVRRRFAFKIDHVEYANSDERSMDIRSSRGPVAGRTRPVRSTRSFEQYPSS
ncbi:type II toxin-antitoxin system MqsA family antitoxin [Achromobacter sp. GG226]|uniref:type II toxin-antitoxin system MqsA family antitoxin n=1 Tax=Verticiella alkaliphila TaxID=2779529 RepID=UPI001C0B3F32|nr:type II toxin-antitoxin system MqsA family antitoxin [Verticiella sp. GG226]MBU4609725.1 type II toxin-antitoxin system MqsA family antitoxin [Verticiella sp. GG226]